jgi:hypothetical protein
VLVTSLMGRLLRSRDGAVVQDYLGAPPRLRLSYTEQHEALFGLAPGGDDVGGAQQWDTAGGGREEGAETKGEREGGAPGEGLAGREDDTGGEDPADGGTDPADGEEETQGEERWRGGRTKKEGKEGVAGGAGVARGKVLGRALTKQQVWEEATARALAHTHPEPYAVPDAILLGLREGSGPASPNEGEADGRDEPGRVTSGSGPAEETEVESEAHAWRKGEGGGAEGAEREGLWRGDGRPRGLEEGRLARQVERSPQRLRGMPDQPAEQQPPTEAQVRVQGGRGTTDGLRCGGGEAEGGRWMVGQGCCLRDGCGGKGDWRRELRIPSQSRLPQLTPSRPSPSPTPVLFL